MSSMEIIKSIFASTVTVALITGIFNALSMCERRL